MGIMASPLRAYFTKLKDNLMEYYFITICGGADGKNSNPKIIMDLEKRVGKKPTKLIELHIADLLPPEPKPTRDDTMKYKLTDEDIKNLTSKVLRILQKKP